MYGRWFNFAVVLLWLSTMTWLVAGKVLPSLRVGDPPDYERILDAKRTEAPVGWHLKWNGRPIGWATSTTRFLPDESTEIRSHVHFDELPLGEMTPGWLRAGFRLLDEPLPDLETDAYSTLTIGPLGELSRIQTSISFAAFPEAIAMDGRVEGSELILVIRSRDLEYQTKLAIDSRSLLGNTLSPQTQLPGLRAGQEWTTIVCSPLRCPGGPFSVLRARVDGMVPLRWAGREESVWLVVYHDGAGVQREGGDEALPCGRLWVRRDGTVLRQEMLLSGSRISFVRMTDDETSGVGELPARQ